MFILFLPFDYYKKNAPVNTYVQGCVWTFKLFNTWRLYLRVEMLDYNGNSMINLQSNHQIIFIVAIPFYIPTSNVLKLKFHCILAEHLVFFILFCFFKIAFSIDIKWYLTVILISLMVICTLSMKKCLFFIDNEPLNQLSVIDEL